MSDKKDDEAATSEDTTGQHDDLGDAQFPDPDPVPELTGPAKASGRAGGFIAWVALLIGIVAIGGVGYLWTLDDDGASVMAGQIADLESRLANLVTSVGASQDIVTSLEQTVASLTRQDAEKARAIERLGDQLDGRAVHSGRDGDGLLQVNATLARSAMPPMGIDDAIFGDVAQPEVKR